VPILQALLVSLLTVRQLDPELALFNARARVLAEQITVAANLTVRRGRLVRVFQLGFNLCDRERKTVSVLWLRAAVRLSAKGGKAVA
jgi:hypothetical protein